MSISPIRNVSMWYGYHCWLPNTFGCGTNGADSSVNPHPTWMTVSGDIDVIIEEE